MKIRHRKKREEEEKKENDRMTEVKKMSDVELGIHICVKPVSFMFSGVA